MTARLPRHRVKGYRTDAALLAAEAWVAPYDPAKPIEEQVRQALRACAAVLALDPPRAAP